MFRLKIGHRGNTLKKPHRCQCHDVFRHASFGSLSAAVLYELAQSCSFTLELLGSV